MDLIGLAFMWPWFKRSCNQKLFTLLASAIAAMAVAAWTVFTYFDQRDEVTAEPSVQADHGVAAGGNIERSAITIEGASDDAVGGK